MIKVLITGTNEVKELTMEQGGTCWAKYLIGNYGAFEDGQFTWDEGADAYRAKQETFDWWKEVIEGSMSVYFRTERLAETKGGYVFNVLDGIEVDLEEEAEAYHKALDEAFGEGAGY